MFSMFDRGRKCPQIRFVSAPVEPLRLDEARLAAWAMALGQERMPERRPHRGQLPDVDWSRVTVVPVRPGAFARLWRRLLQRPPPSDDVPSGVSAGGLAQRSDGAYVTPVAFTTARPVALAADRRAA